MSIDLRLRHDRSLMERAAELFERRLCRGSVAGKLGVPADAVRKWRLAYRAAGRGGLSAWGHRRRGFEAKVAVTAAAIVDDGMTRPAAMEGFGVSSKSPARPVVPPLLAGHCARNDYSPFDLYSRRGVTPAWLAPL